MPTPSKREIVLRKFERKTLDDGGHIIWIGAFNQGLPYLEDSTERKRRFVNARRSIWELVHFPIPETYFVDLSCDNERCVDPGHLIVRPVRGLHKTALEFPEDGIPRYKSVLTEEDVERAFQLRASGLLQWQIAKELRCSQATVSRALRGRKSP